MSMMTLVFEEKMLDKKRRFNRNYFFLVEIHT